MLTNAAVNTAGENVAIAEMARSGQAANGSVFESTQCLLANFLSTGVLRRDVNDPVQS
jgi:hypothetical protein